MRHLCKQISRRHTSAAITQHDARRLFVKLLANIGPQGRCEDHRRRQKGMITRHSSMHEELERERALLRPRPSTCSKYTAQNRLATVPDSSFSATNSARQAWTLSVPSLSITPSGRSSFNFTMVFHLSQSATLRAHTQLAMTEPRPAQATQRSLSLADHVRQEAAQRRPPHAVPDLQQLHVEHLRQRWVSYSRTALRSALVTGWQHNEQHH